MDGAADCLTLAWTLQAMAGGEVGRFRSAYSIARADRDWSAAQRMIMEVSDPVGMAAPWDLLLYRGPSVLGLYTFVPEETGRLVLLTAAEDAGVIVLLPGILERCGCPLRGKRGFWILRPRQARSPSQGASLLAGTTSIRD